MSQIKDLFGDLAGKKIEIEVEGKTLELEMYTDDLHPLMTMNPGGAMTEEQAKKMTDTVRKIIYRSYMPHWNEEEAKEPEDLTPDQKEENEEAREIIENLLLRNFTKIFTEIAKELNWADEGDINQTLKKGNERTSPVG